MFIPVNVSLGRCCSAGAHHHVGRVEGQVPRLQVVRVRAVRPQTHRDALASEGGVVHLETLKNRISIQLTLIEWHSSIRMSAGVLSPPLMDTMSPRTSSEASISFWTPSLTTWPVVSVSGTECWDSLHHCQRRSHLGKALHDLAGLVLLVEGEQACHDHHHHKSHPDVEVVVGLQVISS